MCNAKELGELQANDLDDKDPAEYSTDARRVGHRMDAIN